MSQPALLVRRVVVEGLVDAFLTSGKPHCASFDALGLRAALASLPGDLVDFHAASRVLNRFECNKLTADCNSWTPWMRARLNEAKFKAEAESVQC